MEYDQVFFDDAGRDDAPLSWRLGRAVFHHLPVRAVDQVAILNARLHRSTRPA